MPQFQGLRFWADGAHLGKVQILRTFAVVVSPLRWRFRAMSGRDRIDAHTLLQLSQFVGPNVLDDRHFDRLAYNFGHDRG